MLKKERNSHRNLNIQGNHLLVNKYLILKIKTNKRKRKPHGTFESPAGPRAIHPWAVLPHALQDAGSLGHAH